MILKLPDHVPYCGTHLGDVNYLDPDPDPDPDLDSLLVVIVVLILKKWLGS